MRSGEIAAALNQQSGKRLFWKWFKREEERLAEEARFENSTHWYREIQQHLGALNPGAVAEVAIDSAGGNPHTLVITADGRRKLFDLVRSLVAAAPPLKHWKVVAFRQRRDEGTIRFGNFSAEQTDFLFRETDRGAGKLSIEVQVRGMTSENREDVYTATFLMLDHLLGEQDVETKVAAIRINPLAEAPCDQLQPMQKLVLLVDAL